MAGQRLSTVCYKQHLSSILTIFRLMPEPGCRFPDSRAGQYIALRRDDCKLTKKIGTASDGKPLYGPDLDQQGRQRIGAVTHSYSIASAPWETAERGYLEFYVVLEVISGGTYGRLSESFFRMAAARETHVTYFDRITGTFTLQDRTAGYTNVVMVGTGTGLAPFIAMMKQLCFEARQGRSDGRRYTVLHTNRTLEELAYHQELLDIEASGLLDFVYIPTVSRPKPRDFEDPKLGVGRANNVLRHIFGLPPKEEETLAEARARGESTSAVEAALANMVRPALPKHLSGKALEHRLDSATTVLLTCGNPASMADIEHTVGRNQIRFEMEEW